MGLRGAKLGPEAEDPLVKLAFGPGYRVVKPSATAEEILAASSVESSELKQEEKPFHPGYEYIFKEPFEPALELTKAGIIESGVYVRREVAKPAPIPPEKRQIPKLIFFPTPDLPGLPEVGFPGQDDEIVPENDFEDKSLIPIEIHANIVDVDLTQKCPENPQVGDLGTLSHSAAELAVEPPIKRIGGRPVKYVSADERRDAEAKRKSELRAVVRQAKQGQIVEAKRLLGIETKVRPEHSVLDTVPKARRSDARRAEKSHVPKLYLDYRLVEQDDHCKWCENKFGTAAIVDGKIVILVAEPDHFIPNAERKNDSLANIRAACQVCNKLIKKNHVFESEEHAKNVIQEVWRERGWYIAPPLVPFKTPTFSQLCFN